MGVNTRIGKVAAATYTAPTTSGAAIAVTWTTGEPTASTAVTVADGATVTSTETGVWIASMAVQLSALVADVAAIKASLAQAGADNAAMLAQLNAGE